MLLSVSLKRLDCKITQHGRGDDSNLMIVKVPQLSKIMKKIKTNKSSQTRPFWVASALLIRDGVVSVVLI